MSAINYLYEHMGERAEKTVTEEFNAISGADYILDESSNHFECCGNHTPQEGDAEDAAWTAFTDAVFHWMRATEVMATQHAELLKVIAAERPETHKGLKEKGQALLEERAFSFYRRKGGDQ